MIFLYSFKFFKNDNKKNSSLSKLNPLICHCLELVFQCKIRQKIEITIQVLNKDIEITIIFLLILILAMSKNRISNSKNDKTLAKSSTITIKKCIILPLNISTKSQKTSSDISDFFVHKCG